ncbi:hypothetical protein EIP91_001899 [Steccherinum ochraceum]|uniref:SHSP domain-containing protein n=1 Tax=Steccherinum ochraceum TaxID=92696 RepID=A0A4R0RGX8_9APHY|nr:hypothetical protein EIP91_001899 [Steccherinum ochraceum]
MSLSRVFYDPFYDFDRLFDEALAARSNNNQSNNQQVERNTVPRSMRPRMDVHEDAQNNTVLATFELPGLKKEDVNIDVHNNLLTVSGETKTSTEHDENGYAVRERRFGKFSRSIPLPQGVKNEDIQASLENGVLSVKFPKSTPEQAPKKIAIN